MSNHTDDNPRPRSTPEVHPSLDWPVSRVCSCDDIVWPQSQSFVSVFEGRRSLREMTRAPLREIVNALAFATKPRAILPRDPFGRSRRPSPSAGALHPINVLIVHGQYRVFRYAAETHQLQTLRVAEREPLRAFAEDCRQILPQASGTALVLIGDIDRVAAVYDRHESLLWRDAGVLLQTLALAAAAYRLAFCPLGLLGASVVRGLGLPDRAGAFGVAIVGRPVDV